MIRNYFKTAWRNILKNKFYSAVNIAGLTVGLTVGVLILLWVNDELSYNLFNTKASQVYQVNSQIGTGSSTQIWNNAPAPLAVFAQKEVPGVQNAARIFANGDYVMFRYGEKTLELGKNGNFFVDASIFKIFDFKLLKGNRDKPFPNDQSIIITESTAKNYFGDADPIGKVLKANNKDNYTVAGVMADFPGNSTIKADIFFSTEVRKKQLAGKGASKTMDDDWNNYYAVTFLQIQPGTSVQSAMDKLTQIHVSHQPLDASKVKYLAQSLTKVHLYGPDGNPTAMQAVKVFIIVAILILLIACINYVNLSTARAMLRSKEVSVRKIIGAEKRQLFAQFFIETMLFFVIALALAFVLIALLMPVYNQIAGKQMHFDFLDAGLWKMIGIIVASTVLAASVYPAMLLASFKPVNALKGQVSPGLGNTTFRKVLVVCQFIFSIGLIIGTLIINGQLKYIHEKDLGYDKSYVFTFPMRAMQPNFEAIRAQLLSKPGITGVASSNDNIISANNTTSDDSWEGKQANSSFLVHPINVDQHFLDFFKLKLTVGRGFTGMPADSAHFILNETAVNESGIKDPVGKSFTLNFVKGVIIGVVKDFHFASLKQKIEPAVFVYQPHCRKMLVRTTGRNVTEAISTVQQAWKEYNPGFPFTYNFMDGYYDRLYKSDVRSGTLFSIFAGIAILISCLGLFGLVTYTAQVKIREIGIRKVLGASVADITAMLSKDFLQLVLISMVVASPLAWFVMNKWLQDYTYRIHIQWWVFAVAGAVAIIIAALTLSFQAVKAALANPVKSLRNE